MEGITKDFTLSFTDIQSLGDLKKDSFTLEVSSKSFSDSLKFGGCVELRACEATISLKRDSSKLGETIVDLDESLNAWIPIPPSFQIKLIGSVSAHPKKLAIQVGPPGVSKCSYVKKLQQIEQSEKDIQSRMTETYFALPGQYQDVFGQGVSISPGKGFFRKRTLDSVNSNVIAPDFTFAGHFEVSIANISVSEVDILQHLAIGLLTRKKELEFQLQEIEVHQEALVDFDFFIKSLGDSMVETKGQSEEELKKMKENQEKVTEEIQEILKITENVDKKIEKVTNEVQDLRKKCENLKNEAQNALQKDLKPTQELRKELNRSQKEIENEEKLIESETEKFCREYPEKEYASAVNAKILSLAELQRLVNLRDLELQENLRLQSEVCFLQSELEINSNLNEITDVAHSQEKQFKSLLTANKEEFLKISADSKKNLEKTSEETEKITSSLAPLEAKNKEFEEHLEKSQEKIKSLKSQLENMENLKKSIISKTPQRLSREEFLHSFEKTLQTDAVIRSNLSKELEYLSNLLMRSASSSLNTKRVFRYVEHHLEVQGLQHKSIVNIISNMKDKNPLFNSSKINPINAALGKVLGKNN
jgi:conjugal transfer/entry exclusion protein